MYDVLAPDIQKRFQSIDAKVASGEIDCFDRQGWAYFVDIDETHTAMASFKERDNVFYWLLIGPSEIMPVIL